MRNTRWREWLRPGEEDRARVTLGVDLSAGILDNHNIPPQALKERVEKTSRFEEANLNKSFRADKIVIYSEDFINILVFDYTETSTVVIRYVGQYR